MNFRKTLIATATAVALVAAPAAIASGPVQAATPKAKASGTTLISFKKEYAGLIKLIKPVSPAKFVGSKMTFPITAVNKGGTVIRHSGGITVGGVTLSNPIITVNVAKKTAKIRMAFAGTTVEVFTAKHFKVKADGVDGQVWQGDLHLTKDKVVVKTLNDALGVDSLTPDLGLGQIRVTIKK